MFGASENSVPRNICQSMFFGRHVLGEIVVAPLADVGVAEVRRLVHQHLAELPVAEPLVDVFPHGQRRRLHADLHHLARFFPRFVNVDRFFDAVRHRLFAVHVLAGLEARRSFAWRANDRAWRCTTASIDLSFTMSR